MRKELINLNYLNYFQEQSRLTHSMKCTSWFVKTKLGLINKTNLP